jgi:hypothetical protein
MKLCAQISSFVKHLQDGLRMSRGLDIKKPCYRFRRGESRTGRDDSRAEK